MSCTLPCLLAIYLALPTLAQDSDRELLNFSITGSSNTESPAENATYAMVHHEVQRLLLDIAQAPRSRQYVEKVLSGSAISLSDMISNGSLRFENGLYWLNFSLLTRSDQEIIHQATSQYSQSLADAILKRRSELERLLSTYNVPDVDRKEVAFIILGCFSLDWDGLDLSTAHGYRAVPPKRKGGEFFFMAEETGGLSLKQIYWGSGSSQYGKYSFASFGDHFSPRQSVMYELHTSGLPEIRRMTSEELGGIIGAFMFALHEGPQSAPALTKASNQTAAISNCILDELIAAHWIAKLNDKFYPRIPVLTIRDRQIVSGLRKLGSEVILAWLQENYVPFQEAVKEITPVRNRVPYQQTFDQLWHYLFGIANQKLVEAGLFADPYSPEAAPTGYVPVVFESRLTEEQ